MGKATHLGFGLKLQILEDDKEGNKTDIGKKQGCLLILEVETMSFFITFCIKCIPVLELEKLYKHMALGGLKKRNMVYCAKL